MMVSCGGYKYYDGDLSIVGHRIYYESQDGVTYPRNQTSMIFIIIIIIYYLFYFFFFQILTPMFPMLSFLCFCFPSRCSFWASSIHCSMWHCHHSSLSTWVIFLLFRIFIYLKTVLILFFVGISSSSTRPPLSPPPPSSFILSVLPWVNSLEEVCFYILFSFLYILIS